MAHVEQGSFFEVERTYGVLELNNAITGVVRAAFGDAVWVRGEIEGMRPGRNGHLYFSLVEKSRGTAQSTLNVALLAPDRRRIDRELQHAPGFTLDDGLEVRVQGRVEFYAPTGKVSLRMSAIDPAFTLGRLAADRDRVLRALSAEGLLEAQRRLTLAAVPLHVGLVTSDGSAACTDFLHELEASGLGFRVDVADARVQGAAAERTVLRAIHVLAGRGVDAVCIVRGGGSRTDLVAFDSERIARAIAGLPVPVLTGIGHEIDTSVADAVAHAAFKTPTACAAALVERARQFLDRAEATWSGVARAAVAGVTRHDRRLLDAARHVAGATKATLRVEEQAAAAAAGRLRRCAPASLERAVVRLERDVGRAESAARLRVASQDARVADATRRLRGARVGARLDRDDAAVAAGARLLARASRRLLTDADQRVGIAAAHVGAADPSRLLARGWSVTHHADGRLVRRAGDVEPGDELVTTFADGTVASTAHRTAEEPDARD